MTVGDSLLPVLDEVRRAVASLGFNNFITSIIVTSYAPGSDPLNGDGYSSQTITVLDPPPKTKWMKSEDYLRGTNPDVTVEIGPITPAFATGGYSFEDLEQTSASKNSIVQYLITGPGMGPNGSLFDKVAFIGERKLRFSVQLKRASNP